MAQPALDSNEGVIITVGLVSNNDRWAIVMPVATDHIYADPGFSLCLQAAKGWVDNVMPLLLSCLSSDTSIVYVQGEGMIDGRIPARVDYAQGIHVGTRDPNPMPTSVAALVDFYCAPGQTLSTGRMRVAKNFIAGIATSDVVGDHIQNALSTALEAFAQKLLVGYLGDDGIATFYRVVKATRELSQALANAYAVVIRTYVATQRRRLVPHG